MPPVTIKNKQLILTLNWVQWLLIVLVFLVILMAVTIKMVLLLWVPLIVAGIIKNNQSIKSQSAYHLVLNTQNQWHLVHQATHQVVEAELDSSWQTPVFIALSLSSSAGKFWYMMLRTRLGGEKYARILVGLKHE